MFGFVVLLLVALIGVGAIVFSLFMAKPGTVEQRDRFGGTRQVSAGIPRWPFAAAGAALLVIAAFFLFIPATSPFMTTIGPSDVGIVTAFGHTVGSDLGPGLHMLAPWDGVTVWDDSVQRTAFESGKGNTGCLEIRIAGQQNACLNVVVFWKDKGSASDAQFKAYRTFPRVQAAYFSRGVVTKFYNNVFERYDPIALATINATKSASKSGAGTTSSGTGTTISALTQLVAQQMRATYANTADIISVNSGQIYFGKQVEAALNREIGAKANLNTAVINEQAAAAQHAAAQKLATGNVLTPTVVQHECLIITQTIEQGGGNLPPAWTCTGSGSQVIVGGRTG